VAQPAIVIAAAIAIPSVRVRASMMRLPNDAWRPRRPRELDCLRGSWQWQARS